jgi:hypothetical protein
MLFVVLTLLSVKIRNFCVFPFCVPDVIQYNRVKELVKRRGLKNKLEAIDLP